jgi:uncharacterized membrane protein
MELPAIVLPKIALPFDIPFLLHPAAVHFAIAIPVVILLLELYNMFARRRTIGGFSFILMILTVVSLAAAYYTGNVDGKEAYDLLSSQGQEALKEHKLLGSYLLVGSIVLLVLRLLAMTGKKFFKLLFFVGLVGFTVVTLNQGKSGGDLTYKYGANVVKAEATEEAPKIAEAEVAKATTPAEVKKPAVEVKVEEAKEAVVETIEEVKSVPAAATPVVEKTEEAIDSAPQSVKEAAEKSVSQ